ncbi:DUF4180 domain-containing protein [Streptomyces sp. NPDC002845]
MTTGFESETVEVMHGVPVLLSPAEGPTLRGTQGALDLIGAAFGADASWAAVPVGRLDPDFFRLRTGMAGEFTQKFAQYRIGLAIVGDITAHTATGAALCDLVRESNRGRSVWFVDDLVGLRERMRPRPRKDTSTAGPGAG